MKLKKWQKKLIMPAIVLVVILIAVISAYTHQISSTLDLIADIVFWVFLAGCAFTFAAIVNLIDKHVHGKRDRDRVRDDAKKTLLLHRMRPRREKPGHVSLPDVPAIDATHVYSLAAWKERQQKEAVGRKDTQAPG